VVVASLSAEVGRPTAVIQQTTGSGNMVAGENQALTWLWRTMTMSLDVVTFVKASSLLFSSFEMLQRKP
jgi:hypothetical protein